MFKQPKKELYAKFKLLSKFFWDIQRRKFWVSNGRVFLEKCFVWTISESEFKVQIIHAERDILYLRGC